LKVKTISLLNICKERYDEISVLRKPAAKPEDWLKWNEALFEKSETLIAQLGCEGWEMICIKTDKSEGVSFTDYWLKRPITK
jgi:hypothetical protein